MSAVSSSSDHYVPSDYWNVKSHVQVLTEIRRALGVLLDDPLLPDVSPGVTPEEIDTKLALLRGRALTLLLRFYDDSTIPLVVLQGCTVRDVMAAVEREAKLSGNVSSTVVSWSYVWKTYWLVCGQVRLEDENARLTHYGVGNHSELRFTKKQRQKAYGHGGYHGRKKIVGQ